MDYFFFFFGISLESYWTLTQKFGNVWIAVRKFCHLFCLDWKSWVLLHPLSSFSFILLPFIPSPFSPKLQFYDTPKLKDQKPKIVKVMGSEEDTLIFLTKYMIMNNKTMSCLVVGFSGWNPLTFMVFMYGIHKFACSC